MQRERETIAFSKKRIWREDSFLRAYGEREKKERRERKERKKERKRKRRNNNTISAYFCFVGCFRCNTIRFNLCTISLSVVCMRSEKYFQVTSSPILRTFNAQKKRIEYKSWRRYVSSRLKSTRPFVRWTSSRRCFSKFSIG